MVEGPLKTLLIFLKVTHFPRCYKFRVNCLFKFPFLNNKSISNHDLEQRFSKCGPRAFQKAPPRKVKLFAQH